MEGSRVFTEGLDAKTEQKSSQNSFGVDGEWGRCCEKLDRSDAGENERSSVKGTAAQSLMQDEERG